MSGVGQLRAARAGVTDGDPRAWGRKGVSVARAEKPTVGGSDKGYLQVSSSGVPSASQGLSSWWTVVCEPDGGSEAAPQGAAGTARGSGGNTGCVEWTLASWGPLCSGSPRVHTQGPHLTFSPGTASLLCSVTREHVSQT